jgi:hypothetical protein
VNANQRDTQIGIRGAGRLQLNRLFKGSGSFFILALVGENLSIHDVRQRIIRVELHRLLFFKYGGFDVVVGGFLIFGEVRQRSQRGAEALVGFGIIRSNADGFAECISCFRPFAATHQIVALLDRRIQRRIRVGSQSRGAETDQQSQSRRN